VTRYSFDVRMPSTGYPGMVLLRRRLGDDVSTLAQLTLVEAVYLRNQLNDAIELLAPRPSEADPDS
jgi:hypothetical protein